MKRRTMLGAIVFYSVLGNTLVSCKDKYKAIKELKLKNIKLDNDDLDIIEDISKLIFPTDKIEAFKNHTSLPYTLTVLDDCASPHKQKAFIEGIKTFQQAVQKKFNTSFVDLSPEDKMKFLQETNQSKEENTTNDFFKTIKQHTLEYYSTTEYYLRKIQLYEMAPGRFLGCVKIDQRQTKNL